MNFYRSLIAIFNLKTLIVTVLAIVSTYLCIQYELIVEFSLTLVGIAVVFPIVFTIGGAYTKREDALKYYATIKGHLRSLYYASRDWPETKEAAHVERLRNLIRELLSGIRDFFLTTNEKDKNAKEKHIYSVFSRMSLYIQEFRDRGLQSGEVSRTNQYLSKIMDAFEGLKHVYQYRTPISLRAYSKIFVVLVPIVYGPYFASMAKDFELTLLMSMVEPVLFSIVLVSLDNIQSHLENPFDLVGSDDVKINAEKLVDNLLCENE